MKKLFIILLILNNLNTQAQRVISNAGGDFTSNNFTLSWTLGEAVTQTLTSTNFILTQGVQQPTIITVGTYIPQIDNYTLNVYPNPTSDYVYIKTTDYSNLNYKVYDLNGRLLAADVLNENTRVEFKNYPTAIYFVNIHNNNSVVKTFKIVKQ
jgi:hypothetical protein